MVDVESGDTPTEPESGSGSGKVEASLQPMTPRRDALQPRPAQFFGSWLAIFIGVVATLATLRLTWDAAPCNDFHIGTQFSGSDTRLGYWIGGCGDDLGAARRTLTFDGLLIVSYVFLGASILRRWWPLYQARRLKQRERIVIAIPLVVGAFDAIENLVTGLSLGAHNRRFTYPDSLVAPTIISTFAWLKVLAAAVGVLCVMSAVLLAWARRNERGDVPDPQRDKPVAHERLRPPAGLGVCCSGGGIRAAAYAIGVLSELERHGTMRRARWLTAVSGGNYAATAWKLAKTADPSRPAADDVIGWLGAPIEDPRVRQRRNGAPITGNRSPQHRFLLNGPGGIGRSAIAALFYVAVNVVVLGALVAALSWPVGRLVGSAVIQPRLRVFNTLPPSLHVPIELWLPGVALMACGVLIVLISALPFWWTSTLWRVAAVLVMIGVGLLVLTVGIPAAMVFVGNWLRADDSVGRPALVGGAAIFGALSAVWRLARKPITDRVRKALPKLGGVLLAIAAIVWGGKVATDAATDSGAFRHVWAWVAITLGFFVVYSFVGITRLSIHHIYRQRLSRSFGLRRDGSGALYAPTKDEQLTWGQLPNVRPELVVCCSQQRDGIAPGGLPADTFTISRRRVRIGDVSVPTHRYLQRLPKALGHEHAVSSWMATSGAAFASAMGRMSQGSTNALMAALNIDLGIWLPNPRLASNPDAEFPAPRFGYLFKEILGWYDQSDRFVFVADGGHWDNLGLIELLRRRCATIVCIDASGDDIGRFTTLRQAVELASLELSDVVAGIDLDGVVDLIGVDGKLPKSTVAAIHVDYVPSATTGDEGATAPERGLILYAKAQLAADLAVDLRRFSKSDPKFPNYSTASLFLTQDQFENLVELGRASGLRLTELLDAHVPAPSSSVSPAPSTAQLMAQAAPPPPAGGAPAPVQVAAGAGLVASVRPPVSVTEPQPGVLPADLYK